ncbi:hypothetical protein [Kitasatospora sp. NPDC050543]|uniref:hypothetical protein n=1 Tax=Kitasatospora sp. NPDC050543 TaxID=3364054 RepID=UPI0037930C9D
MLSRRAALLLAAGGLAQLSVPGAAAPTAARRASATGPGPGLTELLDARAKALLGRDAAALAATATAGAAGAQQELRERLAAVPLAGLEYLAPVPAGLPGAGPEVTAELAVRIEGYDGQPARYSRRLALARVGGRWLVEREEPAGGPAALWDLGVVRAAAGAHCLVLGLDGAATGPAEVAAVAGTVVPAVTAVWGTGWAGRLLLELPATEDQFARLLDVRAADYTDMAAVTSSAPGAPDQAPADRVMINPDAYRRLSAFGRQVVLTHEATHVATRADTRAWTPLWLSEGVADWTGYLDTGRTARQIAPELAADVAAGRLPTALPADADFTAGAAGISQAYELSWLACDLLARRYGRQKLVALYRAVGAAGAGAGRGRQLDQVLRSELGTGLGEFTTLWIDEARRLFGGG